VTTTAASAIATTTVATVATVTTGAAVTSTKSGSDAERSAVVRTKHSCCSLPTEFTGIKSLT
jgi:hypothetical protein